MTTITIDFEIPNFKGDVEGLTSELQEAIEEAGCMDDTQLENAEVLEVHVKDSE